MIQQSDANLLSGGGGGTTRTRGARSETELRANTSLCLLSTASKYLPPVHPLGSHRATTDPRELRAQSREWRAEGRESAAAPLALAGSSLKGRRRSIIIAAPMDGAEA